MVGITGADNFGAAILASEFFNFFNKMSGHGYILANLTGFVKKDILETVEKLRSFEGMGWNP